MILSKSKRALFEPSKPLAGVQKGLGGYYLYFNDLMEG